MPEPDAAAELRDAWLRRADALGRAQSRYLWTTFVAGLFFFALKTAPGAEQQITVPIIGVKLNAQSVLAAGGLVLSFLITAFVGAMNAWGLALEEATGDDWENAADYLDLHPTVFDLAFFTTRGATPALERLLYLTYYPGFLMLMLAEAAWLQWWLWTSSADLRSILLVLGSPTLVWAAWLVRGVVYGRAKRVYRDLRAASRSSGS